MVREKYYKRRDIVAQTRAWVPCSGDRKSGLVLILNGHRGPFIYYITQLGGVRLEQSNNLVA